MAKEMVNASQDNGDGQEDSTSTFTLKPSFVIIAIDTHPSMFVTRENEDGEITHPFKDALTACYEVADSLLLVTNSNSWNQFGVVLADEDQKAGFIEVQNNLLESIKLLKEKSELSCEELKDLYERQSDLDLSAFFLLCKKKFKDINCAYYKRTLILITNDDDPVKNDPQKRFTALNEAKTFEASDISFEIVSMKENFDYKLFYNELFSLYTTPHTEEVFCEDKDGLVEKLKSSIIFRYSKYKVQFYPFKNDFTRYLKLMKVNFFKKPTLINSQKATTDGKILKKLHENKGIDSSKTEKFFLRMGKLDEALPISIEDRQDIIGNNLPLGFHLQYVSDRHTDIGISANKMSLLILDPEEELTFFDQFWQYCADKNKVLVCISKIRNPEKIRYVELIPKFVNKMKMFLVRHIPFANELIIPKTLKITDFPSFDSEPPKVKAVLKLIHKLTIDYDPVMFPNIKFAKKKAYVKSKLLNLPLEDVEDLTLNVEALDEQISESVSDIKRVFCLEETQPKGRKRKATAASGSGSARKTTK